MMEVQDTFKGDTLDSQKKRKKLGILSPQMFMILPGRQIQIIFTMSYPGPNGVSLIFTIKTIQISWKIGKIFSLKQPK